MRWHEYQLGCSSTVLIGDGDYRRGAESGSLQTDLVCV